MTIANPTDALRVELETALAVAHPEIQGLHDLAASAISDELRGPVNDKIAAFERRRNLIQNVLSDLIALASALHALDADGYPTLPKTVITDTLFQELQNEVHGVAVAAMQFEAPPPPPPTTEVKVILGQPADKP